MSEDIQDKGPRKRLPSLSHIKSEYEKLCDELGGPADIGFKVKHPAMAICCREYRSGLIVPILLAYTKDETAARRHWPWAAFAISHYVFERNEREKYKDEPAPEGIVELLEQIRIAAQTLRSGLIQLETLSDRLTDPSAPNRRGHLGWLNAIVSQGAAGRISSEVTDDDDEFLLVESEKEAFIVRLGQIVDAAELSEKAVDKAFLKRERSQTDPALPNFVFRCGGIWKSLTGRKPSANKVLREETDDLPDFVVFVQKLAEAGHAPPPSRNQVHSSLRKLSTRDHE